MSQAVPWWFELIKHALGFRSFYAQFLESNRLLYAFYAERIEKHRCELEASGYDGPPADYVDAFLREKRRRDAVGEPHFYSIDQLTNACGDIWVSGQETTTITLAWGLVYLIHHPEVLDRLYAETSTVCGGHERLVAMADRPHLPYTQAVINEIMRIANLLPQNVPHRTTRDVVIDGYHLRKGTAIIPQISVVLCDPAVFAEPEMFRPERFLDVRRCDELVPFSLGKRQCLGEALARMELFLFMANMFSRFKVSGLES